MSSTNTVTTTSRAGHSLKLLKLESVEVTSKMHALATGYDSDTKWNSTRKPTLDEPACVKTLVESLVAQIESLEY